MSPSDQTPGREAVCEVSKVYEGQVWRKRGPFGWIRVDRIMLPGHRHDDGGMPGVSVCVRSGIGKWGDSIFIPCSSIEGFESYCRREQRYPESEHDAIAARDAEDEARREADREGVELASLIARLSADAQTRHEDRDGVCWLRPYADEQPTRRVYIVDAALFDEAMEALATLTQSGGSDQHHDMKEGR